MDWTGTINDVNRFSTIPNVVSGLKVKPNTCNEEIATVDLSRFDFVKKVDIGSNSLQHAQQLTMNGLNKLTEVTIGEGSMNAVGSVNASGLTGLTQFIVNQNSLEETTE